MTLDIESRRFVQETKSLPGRTRRPVAAAFIWGSLGVFLLAFSVPATILLIVGIVGGLGMPPLQSTFMMLLGLVGGVLFLRAGIRIWRREN